MSDSNSTCLTMTTADGSPPPHVSQGNVSSIFTCEIENFRMLVPVLKSICIKSMAIMTITERGLKITCEEDNRTVQATTFIDRSLFKIYEMRDEQTPEILCFRMSDLIHVLSMFSFSSNRANQPSTANNEDCGDDVENTRTRRRQRPNYSLGQQAATLKIKFENIERIKLRVKSGDYSSVAYVQTYNFQKLISFSMSFVNKIIMDSSVMIDFWKCADTQSPRLHLKILDAEPWFEMATDSLRGRFVKRISAHSVHIEHYECTVPLEEQYEMSAMHYTVRPLLLASKISIKMDANGLLNIQFCVNFDQESNCGGSPKSGGRKDMGAFQNALNQVHATPLPTVRQSTSSCGQNYFVEFYIIPCVK